MYDKSILTFVLYRRIEQQITVDLQIDSMESAQDQTSIDVTELRSRHVSARRKLERLKQDMVEVRIYCIGPNLCVKSELVRSSAVEKGARGHG